MVGITYVYIDMISVFNGYVAFDFSNPSLLLSWMFEHDCLDTQCFGCHVCMCFVFLFSYFISTNQFVYV